MLRTPDEEARDREAEAEFWANHDGKTSWCGLVAGALLLVPVVGMLVTWAVLM